MKINRQLKLQTASKSLNTDRQLTGRKVKFLKGLMLGIFITVSPYLFYLYRVPQSGVQVWETPFFVIHASGFYDVSSYLHALFTKLFLVFLASIAFLKIYDWWKWTLLIPIIMFLYQLISVINSNWPVFDEYTFYYSLVPIIPIIGILIFYAIKIKQKADQLDLLDQLDAEIDFIKKKPNNQA